MTVRDGGAFNNLGDLSVGAGLDESAMMGGGIPGASTTGTLHVRSGGTLTSRVLDVGLSPRSQGSVLVSGPGSTVVLTDRLTIGNEGSGALIVEQDASLTIGNGASIGGSAGSDGQVMVRDGGSLNNSGFILTVGGGGLCVADSSSPQFCGGFVAGIPGASTTGTMNIDGGTVTTGGLDVASGGALTEGSVVVNGAGSVLNVEGTVSSGVGLSIGAQGTGSLVVQNEGVVNVGMANSPLGVGCCNSFVGSAAGSSGKVVVRGGGSQINFGGENGGNLFLGGTAVFTNFGTPGATTTASLDILDGGQVNANTVNIGNPFGANGASSVTVTVSGSDPATGPSRLNVSGGFPGIASAFGFPQRQMAGTLNVMEGGIVNYPGLGIGGSVGTLNVIGTGSTFSVDETIGSNVGDAIILRGLNGVASLNVVDGGTVHSGSFLAVGSRTGSLGNVTVRGTGSTVTARGLDEAAGGAAAGIVVGHRNSTGTMVIQDGAQVLVDPEAPVTLNQLAFVLLGGSGTDPRGKGFVTVSGAGSEVRIRSTNGSLMVGNTGHGELTIMDGGHVVLEKVGSVVTDLMFSIVGRTPARTGVPIIGNSGDGVNCNSFPLDPRCSVDVPEARGDITIAGPNSVLDSADLMLIAKDFDITTGTSVEPGGDGRVSICEGGTLKADVIEVGANGTLRHGGFIEPSSVLPENQLTIVSGELIIGCSVATVIFPGTLQLNATAIVILEIDETGASDQLIANVINSDGATVQVIVDPAVDLGEIEVTLITTTSDEPSEENTINFEIVTTDPDTGETQTESIETMAIGGSLSLGFDETGSPTVNTNITIDIKPGSDSNTINLSSSGVIPVAILSLNGFNATTINPSTVNLNGASVKLVGKQGKSLCHQEDVDENGTIDLVCQVVVEGLFIEPGVDVAVLTAETFGGTEITGEDSIRIVQD